MSANHSNMTATGPFDPFVQTITILDRDHRKIGVNMAELDDFVLYGIKICINYGSQLGASLMLLVVLLMLTKPNKRHSPIFIINAVALLVNFIRLVLQCLYFTGPFSATYAYFADDYSDVPRESYIMSIASTVLIMLLLILVELSLLLQTQVVCVTLPKLQRRIIFVISAIMALQAIGWRFAILVRNSLDTLYGTGFKKDLRWLFSAGNITTSISVIWFCLVFVIKLGLALRQRSKLGLRRWGPMHIIFIMGCQTLIIPAVFSLFPYIANLPDMPSNVLTAVALFLPLSSLWAATTVEGHSRASLPRQPILQDFGDGSDKSSSTAPLKPRKFFASSSITGSSTLSQLSPIRSEFSKDDIDLERQFPSDSPTKKGFGAMHGN